MPFAFVTDRKILKPCRLIPAAFGIAGACLFFSSCQTAPTQPTPVRSVTSAKGKKSESEISVTLSSPSVADGSVLRVTLANVPAIDFEIEFEGEKGAFYVSGYASGKNAEALIGIPHGHHPGPAKLILLNKSGSKQEIPFEIVDGKYPSETLKVDEKKVNPPKKVMKRISAEVVQVKKVYTTEALEKRWKGAFVLPIDSKMTSPYGGRRLYNGQERNYHGGLDLRAQVPTPIHAPQDGVVALAKDLYFTGNTVMIDHGYGLISLYAHMSKLKVKVGDRIKQGDLIGISGATGRVSGPHLHWQVYVHSVKVNPLEMMKVVR